MKKISKKSGNESQRKCQYPARPKLPPVPVPRDLSVAEVARALGRCTKWVREELIRTKKLRAFKHGRHWKIPEAELARYRVQMLMEFEPRVSLAGADVSVPTQAEELSHQVKSNLPIDSA